MNSSAKKQTKSKIWQWIIVITIILSLFSGGVLLYQWWKNQQTEAKIQEKEQTLAQLEQQKQTKALQSYQIQQKQLPQVLSLEQNPTIQEFFND